MNLDFEVVPQKSVTVVRCRGRLTYGPETEEFARITRHALDTAKEVVLQMAEVSQIDSGGIGALGALYMAAHNRNAEVKLAALHARVAETLRITGLDMLFDIRDSESAAITAFARKEKLPVIDLEGAAQAS